MVRDGPGVDSLSIQERTIEATSGRTDTPHLGVALGIRAAGSGAAKWAVIDRDAEYQREGLKCHMPCVPRLGQARSLGPSNRPGPLGHGTRHGFHVLERKSENTIGAIRLGATAAPFTAHPLRPVQ